MQQTINVVSPTARGLSANEVDWTNRNGWYVDFNPANDSPGERVNIDPQLVLGTLIVVTNVPASNACTIGGDSWLYQFNYASGSFVGARAQDRTPRDSGRRRRCEGIRARR